MDQANNIPMWKWLKDYSIEDHSVVVACVSVGNVPQLTGDLLVSSLAMQKAASLYSPALVPMCGADPYLLDSAQLCGPADLYVHAETKTALILFRSAVVHAFASKFLNDLVTSLKDKAVKEFIIISSSFAHEKHLIMSSAFRYCTNKHFERTVDSSWLQHEQIGGKIIIHGGGFASKLLEICTEKNVPAMILFQYCSEGDNIPDAVECVGMLSQVLSLFPVPCAELALGAQLQQPISWRLMFGGPPPQEIY